MSTLKTRLPLRTRLLQWIVYGMAALLVWVGFLIELWVAFAFAILAVALGRMLGTRTISQPERSARLRLYAFAAQAVAMLSLASATGMWVVFGVALLILIAGSYTAYRYEKPPILARVGAVVGLHLVFVWMGIGLFSGQPYPQAQVALLALGVVSFELKTRMNLFSGIAIAALNLYVAATLSRDLLFLVFLTAYLGCLLAFMWRADDEDGLRDNPIILRPAAAPRPMSARLRTSAARFALALPAAAGLIFVFTPRFAAHPIIPPLTFNAPIRSGPTGEIINPALPLVQIQGELSSARTESGEYYYGFDSRLDLAYRGGLSDALMMYVRSPAWSYWRSHAYDHYDGRTWSQSDSSLEIIEREGMTFDLKPRTWRILPDDYFVQTFYIQRQMPNLIFTGGDPVDLYLAADEIGRDSTGGLRVGQTLESGMVYSVMSLRIDHTPDELRAAGGLADLRDLLEVPRYLQLPDTVTQRTRDFARELTADAPTQYDKVIAIRDHLLATYPYDFYPPPQPPNTDAVDQFLFVDQRGVCEHYVSAMVVMLRSLNIPARLVAGYGSGDYNAFTNYYEVRANDAHAWVEVYFGELGWVPFDPTPGWDGDPMTGEIPRWIFSGAMAGLPNLPIGEWMNAGIAALGGIGSTIAVIVGVALVIGVIWYARRRKWTFKLPKRRPPHDPARRAIFAAYRRAQRALGVSRAAAQTAREHAAAAPAVGDLAEIVEIAAYHPQAPDESLVKRAKAWRKPRT